MLSYLLCLSPLSQARELQTSGLHTRACLLGTKIKQTISDGVKWLSAKAQSRFNHSNFLELYYKKYCSIKCFEPSKGEGTKTPTKLNKLPRGNKADKSRVGEEGCEDEVSPSEESQNEWMCDCFVAWPRVIASGGSMHWGNQTPWPGAALSLCYYIRKTVAKQVNARAFNVAQ